MNDIGLLPGFLLFLLFGLAGCAALAMSRRHRPGLRWQMGVFLLAFALRFAVAVAIYQFGLISVLGDEDASGWTGGVSLQEAWVEQGVGLLEFPMALANVFGNQHYGVRFLELTTHRGYYYLLAALFYITNSPGRMPAAVMNGFFGALSAVVAYRIAAELFSIWVARRVGWWVCLFPSMIIWSAMTIKEPVVIFLELVALYGCVRLRAAGFSPKYILLCATMVLAMFPFRYYASYILGVLSIASLLIPRVANQRNRLVYSILTLAAVPLLVAGTAALASREMEQRKFDLKFIEGFKSAVSSGRPQDGAGSGVQSDFDMSTPGGFLLGTIFGAAHLLLAPFPWQLGGASLRMALTLPELLYWWYLFFAGVIPGISHAIRRRLSSTWAIFLFLMAFGLLYSMMFANVGLVFRQRAQLLPLLLIFGAVGLERRALRRIAGSRATGPQFLRHEAGLNGEPGDGGRGPAIGRPSIDAI